MNPDLYINFSNEADYQEHLKNPRLLEMKIAASRRKPQVVYIDEVQRIPSILNTVQALVDDQKDLRFLLSGSSARKLIRGRANLLPGRILVEHLHALSYDELVSSQELFDLERALRVGLLPEPYLDQLDGVEILQAYSNIYLREEIQAEALIKNVGGYLRFLELAAELSGQFINYAKIASSTELGKDTIRGFFDILQETLLIHRIEGFGQISPARKARQKDKYYFFDTGVRNAILKKTSQNFTATEKGPLFEHFIFQQLKAIQDYRKKDWSIKTYRDDRGLEVDFVLGSEQELKLIEVKYQSKFRQEFEHQLNEFETLLQNPLKKKRVEKIVVYTGKDPLQTSSGVRVLPFTDFLAEIAAT